MVPLAPGPSLPKPFGVDGCADALASGCAADSLDWDDEVVDDGEQAVSVAARIAAKATTAQQETNRLKQVRIEKKESPSDDLLENPPKR